jgi:SH3-like domain-containing protein
MNHNLTILTVLFTLLSAFTTYAVEDVIVLDNATPSIDAVIALPPDTTGGVAVEMAGASLTLTDNTGEVVLQIADPRVHNVRFNLMSNTGEHTLHLERLDSLDTALVQITSISEFLVQPVSQEVNDNVISIDQSTNVVLNATNPNTVLDVIIPPGSLGMLTITAPNAETMSQFTDVNSTVIATSMGNHINELSMLVDNGDYQYTMLDTNIADETITNVRLTSYDILQNPILDLPETNNNINIQTDSAVIENTAPPAQSINCNASVSVSSVNLRSGPGTGYSVIDYGFNAEVYPVGGINTLDSWVVIGLDDGQSAWLTKGAVNLTGSCDNLAVFDVPYREAQPAEVIVVQSEPIIQQANPPVQQQIVAQSQPEQNYGEQDNGGYEEYDDDDHDDDEEHDHDHDDDDDDDDDDD